jgi:ADP-ribosyl-[dinitrogen reductase] hydrolase
MTFCPGKKQPSSVTGGWSRDLVLDLHAIKDWGAQVLVSLLESHEFLSVRVSPEEISRLTSSLGIEWIDAPIVDGAIPNESFLDKWRIVAPRLRDVVSRGGAVVFCCIGGLGRTGMIAACLLVEAGYSPAEAIGAVRDARRGTIENSRQEGFVLNYQPVRR